MTKIFFYHGMSDRLPYALRLIAGAWAQKKAITIYAPERALAQQLDNLLWTQHSTGFIPHCTGDSPLAAETPILIARSEEELRATGNTTKPKPVPGTPYWVISNTNTGRKRNIVALLMTAMGYAAEFTEQVCEKI